MLYLWLSLGDGNRADYLFSLFIIFPIVYDPAPLLFIYFIYLWLPHGLVGSQSPDQGGTRASSVKVLSPNHWATREFPFP